MVEESMASTGTETVELRPLAMLIARTVEVFGTAEAAVEWLETTNPALGGRTPLDVWQDVGYDRVEAELIAIEHGIVA